MVKMVNRWGNVHVTVTERKAKYLEGIGYKRVEEPQQGEPEGVKLDKMTKPQLEAFAKENGVDLAGCANNTERVAKSRKPLRLQKNN